MIARLFRSPPILVNSRKDKGELRGNSFYETVRCTLFVCRLACCIPIEGLMSHNSELARYTWKSFYTMIFGISLICQIMASFIRLYDSFISEFTLRGVTALCYYTITPISMIMLIRFSKNWTSMLHQIESIEETMFPLKRPHITVKVINLITAGVFLYTLVEHLFYVLYTAEMTYLCFALPDDSGLYLRSYFLVQDSWCFDHISFNYVLGFIVQFLREQAIFMASFPDVLTIAISLYLINVFKHFNGILYEKQNDAILNVSLSWSELQTSYTRLTRLVKIIDKAINPFIFFSFSWNLFFLCQQLFYVINKKYREDFHKYTECLLEHSTDWPTTLYMFFSVKFLIVRMMMVAFLAAHVHTLSREPLNILHTVPSSVYNSDVQRFIDQVYHSNIALSGLEFFYVTRKMILTMVATLITYELVLFQFQNKQSD